MGKELQLVLHMNSGTGKSSYAENSSFHRLIIQKSQHMVEESIRDLLLSQNSSSTGLPKCLNVADLGCSSGPNAFFEVKEIINCIRKTCRQELNNINPHPSVQVFMNDLIANDFNTLFKMLPNFYDEIDEKYEEGAVDFVGGGGNKINRSRCYITVVPGSFYGRLFPDHSIHFLHSSYSLHWLSQVPVGLVSESGESLNKKNIYVAQTSPPSVREAYMKQFKMDFTTFLSMRSEEIVRMGQMVLTFMCKNGEEDGYDYWELLGNTLHDMVSMGKIEERQLVTFDIPSYEPSIEEIKQIIEAEDSFTLKKIETYKLKWDANNEVNVENAEKYVAKYIRAVLETILKSHFGEILMNDLFEMYEKNVSKCMEERKGIVNNVILVLVKK